jgi:phytoene dehydrogenase-like protein
MADYDVIVVGSGAGGLSAALEAANNELPVLVLEAMPHFGGYLNPFRRGQYTFDPGVHYVGELGAGEPFRRVLETLGIADAVPFVELDPDGFDRYVFPDFELRLCKGKERFRNRLVELFPKEERGIDRFMAILGRLQRAMSSPPSGPLGMIWFMLRNLSILKYMRAPYQRLLDDVTGDARLQAALAAICGDYGLPPSRASALIGVLIWAHFFGGAYYPRGGSGAIRDAFVNALKARGAELRNKARVVSISKRRGEFVVATESGDEFTARAVVSDVDPVLALGELVAPELVPGRIRKKAAALRPSGGCLYAFVGTNLDLPSLGITSANIVHYDGYDLNGMFDRLTGPELPDDFPVFFLTSPSVKDPDGGHAPAGHHVLEIFTTVGYEPFAEWAGRPAMKRGDDYTALKERLGMRLVEAAERCVPGLSSHLDVVEFATPLSNEYWVGAVRGGNYGPEQSPDQVGPGRFMSFTAGVEGLFLAGAGTIGGGVSPCIASGVAAGSKASRYVRSRRA